MKKDHERCDACAKELLIGDTCIVMIWRTGTVVKRQSKTPIKLFGKGGARGQFLCEECWAEANFNDLPTSVGSNRERRII